MKAGLKAIGRLGNRLLQPFGVQLVQKGPIHGALDLYPEKERPNPPAYVNIGAGSFYHPYWHNLDTPNEFYARSQKDNVHIEHDLTSGSPLPCASGSLKVLYISHVIEHLTDDQVQYCFVEAFRCLHPGGYFRITCPDIDLEYDAYCRGDSSLWGWPTPWGKGSTSTEQKFLEHFATILTIAHASPSCRQFTDQEIRDIFAELPKEEALQYFVDQIPDHLKNIRPEYHVNWFNVQKIQLMLRKAGFECIYESRFGQSRCPLMRNTEQFDNTVPGLSLYVECQK